MSSPKFVITNQKRSSLKPFFDVYEAKLPNESVSNYLVEIFNKTQLSYPKIRDALEYNQCVFTDHFELPTSNIVKILKKQENESFSAHFVEKYDKTLDQFIKDKKKARVSEKTCLTIMQDILKGLATILQAGYRPVSIRTDNVVRCFSNNPESRQQTWKIKNVVYSSSLSVEENHFLIFEENFSPPEIYGRRNCKDIEYEQSEEYSNALLVWSLGIILAKLLGVEGRLDSKKKLSEFRDREFNIVDVLYIRNEYSGEFLQLVGLMLHFDNKKRIKLRDLYEERIFSDELRRNIKDSSASGGKSSASTNSTIEVSVSEGISSKIKKAVDGAIDEVWNVNCSLFEFRKWFD